MRFLASFWRDARAWDRSVKIGVVMGLVLLIILLTLILIAPREARPLLLVGVIGVVIVMQVLILWGNRHLVTPYTRAQQQFLAGDYEAARDTLRVSVAESEQNGKRPSVDTLTLLGNTYRNLGLLRESLDILTTALQRQPQNPFPLYGFGRTLLAAGRFADAEASLQRSLEAGGPSGIMFDVALAQVLQDRPDAASESLRAIVQDTAQDTDRRWMAQQLLPVEQRGSHSLSGEERQAGAMFWQKETARFASTPYGQRLNDLLRDSRHGR